MRSDDKRYNCGCESIGCLQLIQILAKKSRREGAKQFFLHISVYVTSVMRKVRTCLEKSCDAELILRITGDGEYEMTN